MKHVCHVQSLCKSLRFVQEKLELARLQVEALQKKLVDLDIVRAGLASSNAILEQTAIALQAKRAQAAAQRVCDFLPRRHTNFYEFMKWA